MLRTAGAVGLFAAHRVVSSRRREPCSAGDGVRSTENSMACSLSPSERVSAHSFVSTSRSQPPRRVLAKLRVFTGTFSPGWVRSRDSNEPRVVAQTHPARL
ncbi:hypothetical protein UO65_6090 [Actinokineospora spheciospongiae]|uniref:Uncharacterized protein n=1 Tax=Actinokineospora spheciospongiae TaxID=909613 RepID=W7IPI5_9PSEU|nr:hypothetical protein UO65_6090 [Actinokineospora spheciospongiae]